MKKFFLFAILLGMFALPALAADEQKFELGAGYSFMRTDGTNVPKGWNASFAGYLHPNVAIEAKYSGSFKDDVSYHTFMVGPKFVLTPQEPVRPYVHVLAGLGHQCFDVTHGSTTVSVSNNAFAFAAGGGIDIKMGKNASLRLLEADYIRQTGDFKGNFYRLSFGVVANF